jgi:hypothetical protein
MRHLLSQVLIKHETYIDDVRQILNSNVFNIPERIKEIDDGYFIVFNHKTKSYELHHREDPFNTLQIVFPFTELDSRAIDFVRETSVQRARLVEKELEEQAERERVSIEKTQEHIKEEICKDVFKWCERHTADEYPEDICY